MRILVADDDALSRRILEDYLTTWGYEVVMVRNGQDALQVLQDENRPNIAILDWIMPEMDGVEVCRQLRMLNLPNYVYVIILTSFGNVEDVVKGLGSGADDYIVKPFHPDELKYRLQIGERIIKLEQRILCMARTDYLTGLLNRRAFMDRLTGELHRADRQQGRLGVIIADIDYFKRVNDKYGHQDGDLVLQEVAKVLQSNCRPYDFIGRYGGEEFIACLPGAGLEDTFTIAERMRLSLEVQSILLPDQGDTLQVTASFGISALENGSAGEDELIKRADDALYSAKGSGRNRVMTGRCQ